MSEHNGEKRGVARRASAARREIALKRSRRKSAATTTTTIANALSREESLVSRYPPATATRTPQQASLTQAAAAAAASGGEPNHALPSVERSYSRRSSISSRPTTTSTIPTNNSNNTDSSRNSQTKPPSFPEMRENLENLQIPDAASVRRIIQGWGDAYLNHNNANTTMMQQSQQQSQSRQPPAAHDESSTTPTTEPFQPLQMLQDLNLCGPGMEGTTHNQRTRPMGLFPLHQVQGAAPHSQPQQQDPDPFETILLRHTHSSPLQYRSSQRFMDGATADGEDEGMVSPRMGAVEPMRRSSSSPSSSSAFSHSRVGSAFGQLHVRVGGPAPRGASAFSLPQRFYSNHLSSTTMSDPGSISVTPALMRHSSAFNPVLSSPSRTAGMFLNNNNASTNISSSTPVEAELSKDGVIVTVSSATPPGPNTSSSHTTSSFTKTLHRKPQAVEARMSVDEDEKDVAVAMEEDTSVSMDIGTTTASAATSTAASVASSSTFSSKFFSDVKALRRRRKGRTSGRDNPVRPQSSSSKEDDSSMHKKGSVVSTTTQPLRKPASSSSSRSMMGDDDNDGKASPMETASASQDDSVTHVNTRSLDPLKEPPAGKLSIMNHTLEFSDDDDDQEDDLLGDLIQQHETVVGRYHRLDSDDVIYPDEAQHDGQGFEATSVLRSMMRPLSSQRNTILSTHAESPTPIPSPAYQQFLDDNDENAALSTSTQQDDVAMRSTSTGRSRRLQSPPLSKTPTRISQPSYVWREEEEAKFSPMSHDSGTHFSRATTRSTLTSNTSGHTTQATSISGTISSGQITVTSNTSSVADADREVMETNRAERLRRLNNHLHLKTVGDEIDGTASVHSSSTASTNTNAYLALASSPAPLRDGACLPVDRFFSGARIPISYSSSTNTSSTGSSGGTTSGPTLKPVADRGNLSIPAAQNRPSTPTNHKKSAGADIGSPTNMSSASKTTSSGSSGEEPPRFVSYLDRQTSATALHVKVGSAPQAIGTTRTLPQPPTAATPSSEIADADEERSSAAEIEGYTRLASPQGNKHPLPSRKREKVKKRWTKRKSKPPRSPVKSNSPRSPTSTPPPPQNVASTSTLPSINNSLSPYPVSPPRHILDPQGPYSIEQRIGTEVSRPRVLRSISSSSSDTPKSKMILVPPSTSSSMMESYRMVISPTQEGAQEVFMAPSTNTIPQMNTTYRERLIKSRLSVGAGTHSVGTAAQGGNSQYNSAAVVTPDKVGKDETSL